MARGQVSYRDIFSRFINFHWPIIRHHRYLLCFSPHRFPLKSQVPRVDEKMDEYLGSIGVVSSIKFDRIRFVHAIFMGGRLLSLTN